MYKIFVTILFSFGFCESAFAASFDCEKAATKFEKAICGNEELSALDQELSITYKNLKQRFPSFIQENLVLDQRAWLKERNEMCKGAEIDCLNYVYKSRIETLNMFASVNLSDITFDGSDPVIKADQLIVIFADEEGNRYPSFIQYPNTKASLIKQFLNKPFKIGFSPYNTFEQPLSFEKDGKLIEIVTCNEYLEAEKNGYGLGEVPGTYRAVINYLRGCREAQYLIDISS